MHRYVDLDYQYLTSSYACMLSCPISLRPFVILEGTGLGPRGAQGQTEGGLWHQHPCGGKWCSFFTVYTLNTDNKQNTHYCFAHWLECWLWQVSSRVVETLSAALNVELTCCQKWKIFILVVDLNHWKMAVCHLSAKAHKHVFLRSVNTLNKSAFGFHLLRITLWMSLCGYTFLFLSLKRKCTSS